MASGLFSETIRVWPQQSASHPQLQRRPLDQQAFPLAPQHLLRDPQRIPLRQQPRLHRRQRRRVFGAARQIYKLVGIDLFIVQLRRLTEIVVELVAPFAQHPHRPLHSVRQILAKRLVFPIGFLPAHEP